MNKPLFKLAENNELPAHQYMDEPTAKWLLEQHSQYLEDLESHNVSTLVSEQLHGGLGHLYPQRADFLDEQLCDSIHGQRHALRVALFSIAVSKLTDVPLGLLQVAAKFHDVRRLHDREDRGHGARAAEYVAKLSFPEWSPTDLAALDAMVRYHEVDYPEIPNSVYLVFHSEIDAFKAADAMDRARLPKLRWWPRRERIKLTSAHHYLRSAALLTIQHELSCCEVPDRLESSIYELLASVIHEEEQGR